MTVQELQSHLKGENPPTVLDVREFDELHISKLEGILHIPMEEVPAHAQSLLDHKFLAVICRSGKRSDRVAEYLRGLGHPNVHNVEGGMNAWAADIDPSLPTY